MKRIVVLGLVCLTRIKDIIPLLLSIICGFLFGINSFYTIIVVAILFMIIKYSILITFGIEKCFDFITNTLNIKYSHYEMNNMNFVLVHDHTCNNLIINEKVHRYYFDTAYDSYDKRLSKLRRRIIDLWFKNTKISISQQHTIVQQPNPDYQNFIKLYNLEKQLGDAHHYINHLKRYSDNTESDRKMINEAIAEKDNISEEIKNFKQLQNIRLTIINDCD